VCIQGKLGVLQLSLCYQPASETITIVIMKARDLKAKDINGLSGNMQTQTFDDRPRGGCGFRFIPIIRRRLFKNV